MSKIVVELEKLNDLHCGLGQVCLHLGKRLHNYSENIFYYMPKDKNYLFPKHHKFIAVNKLHRKVPFSAPRADLWHCLHQDSEYFPRNKNAKIILTIHDLNFLYEQKSDHEKQVRLNKLQKKIDKASALTFVSHFTQDEVEKNLNTIGKIKKVIHNGISLDGKSSSEKPSFVPDGKFLFSIGTVVAKKNFHVLVDFLEKEKGYQLVLAGWKDNNYAKEIELKILEKNLQDRFILAGNISEGDKIWLYRHCEAFIFPSLQEGFGLPVIEAMSFGKPVFLSRYTSLPEVGGELAFYFDNFKAEQMVKVFQKGMETFLQDSNYSHLLKEHALQFSWENAAKAYWNLYQNVLST